MDDMPTFHSLMYEEKKKKRPPRPNTVRLALAAATAIVLEVLATFVILDRRAAEADLTGHWHGTLTQEPGGITTVYRFSLTFTQQETQITGVSRIWLPDAPSEYGLMALSGTLNNNVIHFTET